MTSSAPPSQDISDRGGPVSYTGRFAPSPTGPLHMGSLIAALASFFDARARGGKWLLRMEDLDPPREPAGAAEQILRQLQSLGLHWDGEVLYQSQRLDAYEQALAQLDEAGLCYRCVCSRKRIRAMDSHYDGRCRNLHSTPGKYYAIRVLTTDQRIEFIDRIQGLYGQQLESEIGDFVVRRKDGLFAYQLAVVVDDEFQGVTDIVRGYDLLDSTPRQIYLQHQLGMSTPSYAHIPVLVNAAGQKLSKQHFADAIDTDNAARMVHEGMKFLGLRPPAELSRESCSRQLDWGISHWDIQAVPKLANIPEVST